jgi:hypothetical protein
MLKASDKATPDSDVIVTELDGEAVLLNLDTKLYFSLNATGVRIWNLLAEGLTLGQIGEQLFQEYDVTPEKAQQCVLDLIGQLNDEKLVTVTRD